MASASLRPRNPLLPNPESVIAERTLLPRGGAAAAAGGAAAGEEGTYRILRTDEVDAYDPAPSDAALAALAAGVSAPLSDEFKGTARKAAKISVSAAPVESFADLRDLIASLVPDSCMVQHKPEIGDDVNSGRVSDEERNVNFSGFLYAASRERDNDFHLIVGRDPADPDFLFMNVELSGLPPAGSVSRAVLEQARDDFKEFFVGDLPGTTYDFYDPPVPVEIEGSLFFDVTHSKGEKPGPMKLKAHIPSIWEVHPITRIVFEP
jgi:hypothetical protein